MKEAFGYLLAFTIPGVLAFLGATVFNPGARVWLGRLDATVGGFLFFLLVATAIGALLQPLRWAVFEFATPDRRRPLVAVTSDAAERLADLRDQHYRYYQSHGAVAIVAAIFALWWATYWKPVSALVAVLVSGIHVFAAREALDRFHRKVDQLAEPGRGFSGKRPA